jgi:hypothetical protein
MGQKLKEALANLDRMRKRDGRGRKYLVRQKWGEAPRTGRDSLTSLDTTTSSIHPCFAYCVGPWLLNNLSTSAFTSALSVVPFLLPLPVVPSHKAVSLSWSLIPFSCPLFHLGGLIIRHVNAWPFSYTQAKNENV